MQNTLIPFASDKEKTGFYVNSVAVNTDNINFHQHTWPKPTPLPRAGAEVALGQLPCTPSPPGPEALGTHGLHFETGGSRGGSLSLRSSTSDERSDGNENHGQERSHTARLTANGGGGSSHPEPRHHHAPRGHRSGPGTQDHQWEHPK